MQIRNRKTAGKRPPDCLAFAGSTPAVPIFVSSFSAPPYIIAMAEGVNSAVFAPSPNGKAAGFDPAYWWFESAWGSDNPERSFFNGEAL